MYTIDHANRKMYEEGQNPDLIGLEPNDRYLVTKSLERIANTTLIKALGTWKELQHQASVNREKYAAISM